MTPKAAPVKEKILIDQPKCAEMYYKGNAKIDQHNRIRQADLKLETKIGTMDWSKRANISLFGMMVVDAYLLAIGCQGRENGNHCGGPRQFFKTLAAELINNNWDKRSLQKRKRREEDRDNAVDNSPDSTTG